MKLTTFLSASLLPITAGVLTLASLTPSRGRPIGYHSFRLSGTTYTCVLPFFPIVERISTWLSIRDKGQALSATDVTGFADQCVSSSSFYWLPAEISLLLFTRPATREQGLEPCLNIESGIVASNLRHLVRSTMLGILPSCVGEIVLLDHCPFLFPQYLGRPRLQAQSPARYSNQVTYLGPRDGTSDYWY